MSPHVYRLLMNKRLVELRQRARRQNIGRKEIDGRRRQPLSDQ